MKSHFVRELEPNQTVTSHFIVQAKEVRLKKRGDPYLSLTLADRTGELDAKMWDNVDEVADTFDRDDFVKVKGLVQVYRNRPQMTVHKLRRLNDAEVDLADYFPRTERDVEEMWRELWAAVSAMGNPHLRALLEAFLNDEEVARRYRIAPAAKSMHHATLGGLLEHVVSLVNLCRFAAKHYPFLDLDLLITGAVLHDVGKIYELHYDRSFGYTTEGQLLGHMIIALKMLQEKAAGVAGFPDKLKTLVEHMILSHHGHYEFGSPRLPMFPEALLLHYLDEMDSKLESIRCAIQKDQNIEGVWTGYNAALERTFLKKDKYLAEEPAEPAKTGRQAGPSEGPPQEVREPSHHAPAAAPRPSAAPTLLGEKLQTALKGDDGSK